MSLHFRAFESQVEPSFWQALGRKKLDELQLSEEPIPVVAWFRPAVRSEQRAYLQFSADSFATASSAAPETSVASGASSPQTPPPPEQAASAAAPGARSAVELRGTVVNVNTKLAFKGVDKAQLLRETAQTLWTTLGQDGAELEASQVAPFVLLTYADLKKHVFLYWLGVPAVVAPPKSLSFLAPVAASPCAVSEHPVWKARANELYVAWRNAKFPAVSAVVSGASGPDLRLVARFDALDFGAGQAPTLAVVDPSGVDQTPPWIVRNALVGAALQFLRSSGPLPESLVRVDVVLLRGASLTESASDVAPASFSTLSCVVPVDLKITGDLADALAAPSVPDTPWKVVGWEPNERGRPGPRMVKLDSQLDRVQLADQAAKLNLKLMKWRALPGIDLESISGTRCLLVGSGTLGCNVARSLLAWGVHSICFLDNSTVSLSNPARQSLFEFADTAGSGKPKAEAAAEAIRRISPTTDTRGVQLSIPMPGHAISAADARSGVETLDALVQDADVVFLLTDSRESRWLPTVLAAKHRKLVVNAALGFDTFVVMRHGMPPPPAVPAEAGPEQAEASGDEQLACYFCAELIAPTDSISSRSLDMQCTVTRPGVSMLAASAAVELLINVLQHPRGAYAPANAPAVSRLGPVPHQVRGSVSQFSMSHLSGPASPFCTACSAAVVDRASDPETGKQFLVDAIANPKLLQDVTGVTKQLEDLEEMDFEDDDW